MASTFLSFFQDYIDLSVALLLPIFNIASAFACAAILCPPLTTPHALSLYPLPRSEGQVRAERLYQIIVVVPSVIGFFHGFYLQSFFVTFKWWLAGAVVAGLVAVPSWPLYLRDRVQWQPMPPAPAQGEEAQGEGQAEGAAAEPAAEEEPAADTQRKGKGGKGGKAK